MKNLSRSRFLPILPFLLAAVCMGIFSACYKIKPVPAASNNGVPLQPLQSILENNADFSDFDSLLKKSGLYQRVAGGDSSYTLLIPNNEAFAASTISVDSLMGMSADSLQAFVGYYILAGTITTDIVPQTITNPYTTLSGQTIYFSKPLPSTNSGNAQLLAIGSKTLNINGITTNQVDLLATNGVVQVLSSPLSPPYASIQAFLSRPEYSYLAAALKKFNLWGQLDSAGPYTVFAPVNSAFINEGITMDMISSDTFNTSHYQAFLFSAGILSGRIFLTDFTDAPVYYVGQPAYSPTVYSVDGFVGFNNISNSYNPPPTITAFNWHPYIYGGFNQIGPNPNYTITNQPAVNGVINGLGDILVYPDSVYIAQ